MASQSLIPARASTPEEQSDAVIVSFRAHWHQHLLAKDFSVVIRKQAPKYGPFKWLYFHINSPISAICARAHILQIKNPSAQEVLAMCKEINLTPAEISLYLGEDASVGCYMLADLEFPARIVTRKELATTLEYRPPQSFVILSRQAKEIIDEMAGFAPHVPIS